MAIARSSGPGSPRNFARSVARRTMARLPEAVRAEVQGSISRLTKIRSLDEASTFLSDEVERLLRVVAPTFARYPLPVNRTTGRLAVGLVAGGAALAEEFEEVATLVTAGAAAPAVPFVLAADFAALVFEAYVAASVRVHDLERAGLAVVPDEVARDLAQAMTGSSDGGQREITKAVVAAIAKRLLRRWAAGAAPLAGIAYDGWDAQRTVAAIAQLPLPSPDGG